MGTRSRIGYQAGDKIRSVYCHWDGYLSHNGKLLLENYTSDDLVIQLVEGGDISSLGEVIGEKHDFEYRAAFGEKYKQEGSYFPDYDAMHADPEYQRLDKMTHYYGRDRGEEGCKPVESFTLTGLVTTGEKCWAEYIYLWKDGQWFVVGGKEDKPVLHSLAEAFATEEAENQAA